MSLVRLSVLAPLMLVSGLSGADVSVQGPVEFGVFEGTKAELQSGERVIRRSNESIEPTHTVPAKLGTKFGIRYQLAGKTAEGQPLTLLYFTPGIRTPDGVRHDKLEVMQKLLPGAPQDVMAYEFTESHEVVPGEWCFMVFQGDRLLTQQSFTVQ